MLIVGMGMGMGMDHQPRPTPPAKLPMPAMEAPALPVGDGTATEIHLSTFVTAVEGNLYAFTAEAWVPYLKVCYRLDQVGGDWSTQGYLMPMMSAAGGHYGGNAPINGPGTYKATFIVSQPVGVHRHLDRETRIPDWWAPFVVEWEFVFLGTGKKGGY